MPKKGVNLRTKIDLYLKNYIITYCFILREKFINFLVIYYFCYKGKYVKNSLIFP